LATGSQEQRKEEKAMKTIIMTALVLAMSPAGLGCAPASGTQPHAMSAAEHEAAASKEAQAGASHADQYDPAASTTKKTCNTNRAGTVCWTSDTNPTEEHDKEANEHRQLATQHRAASEALRSAEASTCFGIPEEDRDISPFAHREDIRSVQPLSEDVRVGKANGVRVAGAELVFRAVPGMTAEWLQRVVDCHLARNAAIGHQMAGAEMAYCPLTLRGAQARVRSVGNGFSVAIRADDETTSKEILRRAQSLQPAEVAQK
jgi:hypothetical protein